MKQTSLFRRHWKVILNLVTVLALIVLVYAIRAQLVETFKNLAKVHASALLLLIPLQALGYHAQTRMYQGLFAVVGNKLKYGFLMRTSLELNFVNHVFPSGGVSGISYFSARLKNDKLTATKATLVQLMKLVLLFLSFEVVLIVGLLFMAIGNRVNDVVILTATLISTLLVVGTLGFASIVGSERRIRATFTYFTGQINKFVHFFKRNNPETISTARAESIVMDLHENYRLIRAEYKQLKRAFFWASIINVTEILSIYVVYIAFGELVNVGAVILAYAVANFAGLVSVLPGGVGIYEALMTGTLAAAGIPARISLPVTVMYRVVNTLLQIPIGYYFYNKSLRDDKDQATRTREMHAS